MRPGEGLWKYDLLMLAAVGVAVLGAKAEFQDVEITAKHERAAAEKKADVKPDDVLWLRLSLECDQYIAMRGAGQQWKRRPVCADFSKETK